jgi:gliding motility-associated-like protein
VTNVGCNGGNTGKVIVAVTGGTPAVTGYTYSWSPVAGSKDSLTNLSAGTYTVTVRDSLGCTITASGTVSQPVAALAVQSTVTNVGCGGASNGSIQLVVNGGTPAYSFSWSGGQQTQDLFNIGAGAYVVTVTDAGGCSLVIHDTVRASTPVVVNIAGTNATCAGVNNGSATLSITSGTGPFTFFWSNFSNTQNQDSLSGGTYYVIITDGTGCQTRDSVKITNPLPISLTETVTPISCSNSNDGSIVVNATGGTGAFSYAWTPAGPNSGSNTNLSGGNYTVTVSDVNHCSATISASLINPTQLTVSDIVQSPRCNGDQNGSINLYALGGTPQYTYTWSPSGPNSPYNNNLGAGTYTVTVADAHGCNVTASIQVVEPNPLFVSGIQQNVTCYGLNNGYIFPTPYGGSQPYSYQWYLGADTFAPVGPITENIIQLAGGSYYLIVTDANGCRVPFTRTISSPDSLTITPSATNATCAGAATGSVSVAVTGGTQPYQYLWNDFAATSSQSGVSAGSYTVVVTDSNGCHKNQSVTVTQPSAITLTGTAQNPACAGINSGSIALSVTGGEPGVGGYSYSWNTTPAQATDTASGLSGGNYVVTVSDSVGCTSTATYILTSPTAIQVNTAVSDPTCSGGDNGFISEDVHGGTAPYSYAWTTVPVQTGNVASALPAGRYYDTITDAKGCIYIDSATIVSPAPIVVSIDSASATCAGLSGGGVVIVGVTGGLAPYSYALGDIIQSSDTLRGLSQGSYTVAVTDLNGCVGKAPVTIGALGSFTDTLTASPDVILAGQTVQLHVSTSSDTGITAYVWYPSDSLNFSGCGAAILCDSPTAMPMTTQDYSVTVINARGCSLTSTVHVTVSTQASVFVPSAFTPNNDGLNDYFVFDILGATTINVQIWNRWGELVYSNGAQPNGMSTTNAWNGNYPDGKKAEFDTYTYQLTVSYYDGHIQTMSGTVTLLR